MQSSVNKSLSMKQVGQIRKSAGKGGVWDRFDRLQRSLRPLRKDHRVKRGIYRGHRS